LRVVFVRALVAAAFGGLFAPAANASCVSPNVCLGVWERTGPFTSTPNHLALSWDGAGNAVGPATITETVTLGRDGDSFTGTFTITQYALDGRTVLPPTPIVGTLAGTRITPD